MISLIENVIPDCDVALSHSLGDIGANSLDLMEITMNLEREFDVELDDDRIGQCKTVGDIVKLLADAQV